MVKKENIVFIFVLLLISCKSSVSNDQQIEKAKREMTNFFLETLELNYGRKDDIALKWLLEGLSRYNFNYIIEVNRKELREINMLNERVLHSYFFDYEKMAAKRVMTDDWTHPELFNPYAPMSATEFKNDDTSVFWKKEISVSNNILVKDVAMNYDMIGGYAFTSVKGIISSHLDKNSSLISNDEVLTFLTLCFWEYLCYCANVDFVTGKDKTMSILNH